MSPQTVTEKIAKEADVRIAEIQSQTETQLATMREHTEAEITRLREAASFDVQKKKEHLELVIAAKARQMAQQSVQTAERSVLDAVFIEVVSDITALSSAEYVAFFAAHAVAQLPKQATYIRIEAPAHRLAETKDILDSIGVVTTIEVNPRIAAGCIAFTNDGVYDITLSRILDEVRTKLEMQIIAMVK